MHVAYVQDDVPESRWEVRTHSQHLACEHCGRSFEPLTPHSFSFNSPLGWCPTCEGLGVQVGANPAALLRDPKLHAGPRGRRPVARSGPAACSQRCWSPSLPARACPLDVPVRPTERAPPPHRHARHRRAMVRSAADGCDSKSARHCSASNSRVSIPPWKKPRACRRRSALGSNSSSTKSNARPAAAAACATTPRPCVSAAARSTSSAACRWAELLQDRRGLEAHRRANGRSPASCSARSPAACSSWSTWASTI